MLWLTVAATGHTSHGIGAFGRLDTPTPGAPNDPLQSAVLDAAVGAQPKRFSLEQNFPNPFNRSTVIRFSLPGERDAAVSAALEIFGPTGQRLVTLMRGHYPPGAYRVRWDGRDQNGSDVGSGVYLYRLQVGSRVETRRMVLLQ